MAPSAPRPTGRGLTSHISHNEKPIVSVLRVLRAFTLMGANRKERKREMCKLMSDNLYWEKWCVDSEWIID